MKKYEKKVSGNRISFSDGGREIFWMEEQLVADNTAVEVKLGGDLKADSVHEFKVEVEKFLAVGVSLELDLSQTEKVSAVYMHEFVHIQQAVEKKEGVTLVLKDLSEAASAAFREHGIDALLRIR